MPFILLTFDVSTSFKSVEHAELKEVGNELFGMETVKRELENIMNALRYNKFIEANPGIKSRINTTVYFDSYDPDTMVDIVHHLAANAGLQIAEDCDPLMRSYFEKRTSFADFGNGREARSLLEQSQVYLANRLITSKEDVVDYSLIVKEDVEQTIHALTEMNVQQQGIGSRIGYPI